MKTKFLCLAAMLCAALTATANDAKISGRIKDANDKSAVIGATVLLMQDTVQIAGTTTDNSGKFTIDDGNGDYILELSYIGYETIRMALTVNENTHIGTHKENMTNAHTRTRSSELAVISPTA